jgi:hypothetical protein
MIVGVVALSLFVAESQHVGGRPGEVDVLRAPPHLLRSQIGHPDPEAIAPARAGHPIPQTRGNAGPRPTLPVLAFPEPGIDDTAAYQGYQTRFYRDSKQNTVQVYLEPRGGRAVLVWADGANESAGFTVRDTRGRPARVTWRAQPAQVADSGTVRSIEYRLISELSRLELGWFILGSMRVERDFVYAERHLLPFTARPFVVAEESLLVASVARLPTAEQQRHLALLGAESIEVLRSRLQPTITLVRTDTVWTARVERPSLEARNHLALEIRVDPRRVRMQASGRTVSIRTRPGVPITFAVKVETDAAPLSPLSRKEIFNREFLKFLAAADSAQDSAGVVRARRLERQVRAVELLSAREKLMAGLPNFATYFGRDMMMTALMMRPIWSPEMAEHIIGSVLRKLGPAGRVSHEEALGGQAIRENAVVYDSLIKRYFQVAREGPREKGDGILRRAHEVLENLQATRENYHMIDDEFQLPVLAAKYLSDPAVSTDRKRAFLSDTSRGGVTRLSLLLKQMALVASQTRPYAENPRAINLVSFPKRDSVHWRSASWRDSDAGYAGGRFAMDVNAIWAPQALEAISMILTALPRIGVTLDTLTAAFPGLRETPLGQYTIQPDSLRRAIQTWNGARTHFEVALGPSEVRARVHAKLAWLSKEGRRYWEKIAPLRQQADSFRFLALSLDSAGTPIPVVNTDPATALFLESFTGAVVSGAMKRGAVLADVTPFMVPYPIGLLVDGLGPLVANDAYASREIWGRFRKDHYHGPGVVWGREVNLFLIGIANQIAGAFDAAGQIRDPELTPYVTALDQALRRTLAAVHASGLEHNELWSYRIEGGRLKPVRYGTSSDIQLWNTTNLVVQFVLSRLPSLSP